MTASLIVTQPPADLLAPGPAHANFDISPGDLRAPAPPPNWTLVAGGPIARFDGLTVSRLGEGVVPLREADQFTAADVAEFAFRVNGTFVPCELTALSDRYPELSGTYADWQRIRFLRVRVPDVTTGTWELVHLGAPRPAAQVANGLPVEGSTYADLPNYPQWTTSDTSVTLARESVGVKYQTNRGPDIYTHIPAGTVLPWIDDYGRTAPAIASGSERVYWWYLNTATNKWRIGVPDDVYAGIQTYENATWGTLVYQLKVKADKGVAFSPGTTLLDSVTLAPWSLQLPLVPYAYFAITDTSYLCEIPMRGMISNRPTSDISTTEALVEEGQLDHWDLRRNLLGCGVYEHANYDEPLLAAQYYWRTGNTRWLHRALAIAASYCGRYELDGNVGGSGFATFYNNNEPYHSPASTSAARRLTGHPFWKEATRRASNWLMLAVRKQENDIYLNTLQYPHLDYALDNFGGNDRMKGKALDAFVECMHAGITEETDHYKYRMSAPPNSTIGHNVYEAVSLLLSTQRQEPWTNHIHGYNDNRPFVEPTDPAGTVYDYKGAWGGKDYVTTMDPATGAQKEVGGKIYMMSMIAEALLYAHQSLFPAWTAIETAVLEYASWLTHPIAWAAAQHGWVYVTCTVGDDGRYAGGAWTSLNTMSCVPLAYAYAKTGNPTYRAIINDALAAQQTGADGDDKILGERMFRRPAVMWYRFAGDALAPA